MYTFATIFGMSFISICSAFTIIIYYLFPINGITSFLKPTKNSTYNMINTNVLPIIVWNGLMLPVIGDNSFYILSVLFNIIISMVITYAIKVGFNILFDKDSIFIDLITICLAAVTGQLAALVMLLLSSSSISIMYNLIGIFVILGIYILSIYKHPKCKFFTSI